MSEDTIIQDNEDKTKLVITDVLQAHDILISVLLGQVLAKSEDPLVMINQIIQMTEVQGMNPNAKKHIQLLLEPLRNSLEN